jgi:nitric-oxide synthase, brain
MLIELVCPNNISYQPGDHVGVFPCNRPVLVDGLLERLRPANSPENWSEKPMQLQTLSEKATPNGTLFIKATFTCSLCNRRAIKASLVAYL